MGYNVAKRSQYNRYRYPPSVADTRQALAGLLNRMQNHLVVIEKIVHGGYGLGRLDSGKIVLVRHVLPRECVIVTSTETKKNYLLAKPYKIKSPSSKRITPPCPYYSGCGGCDLQHLGYADQLQIKKEILMDLLNRAGLIGTSHSPAILPPLASPGDFHYRQRIRLQVDSSGRLGFFGHRSHQIVAIKACLLAAAPLNSCLAILPKNRNASPLIAASKELELQLNPKTNKVNLIFYLNRKMRKSDGKKIEGLLKENTLMERGFLAGDDFAMEGPFSGGKNATGDNSKMLETSYSLAASSTRPLTLCWEVGGFSQVNLDQNRNLIQLVTRLAEITPHKSLLDLYCGMGNLSLPLAPLAASVTGVEGQGAAIRSAIHNALENKLANTSYYKAAVEKECLKLCRLKKKFDVVLLDPPRAGIQDFAEELAAITGERLIYVSCDPATLCRDLVALKRAGFSLVSIHPVDMFPQTHHLETVALLVKNC